MKPYLRATLRCRGGSNKPFWILQICAPIATAIILDWHGSAGFAYPPYQEFIEKHSGRTVNCAMCHSNDAGPQGDGPGQLGSLTEKQMVLVNQARTAMQPGVQVNSPILNKFGNEIICKVGLQKFLQAQAQPETLATALGNQSDLDGDGIPDSQEYLDGTDPLDRFHGDPGKLFWINLKRSKFDISLTLLATVLITYGITEVIKAFRTIAMSTEQKQPTATREQNQDPSKSIEDQLS